MDQERERDQAEWRGTGRLIASLAVGSLAIGTVAVLLLRPDGRIDGVVRQDGRPVPRARVAVTISMSNGDGSWVHIPVLRPVHRLVVADAAGRYVVDHARTDVVLSLCALPAAGAGAMALVDVQARSGETVTMDLEVPVLAAATETPR